MSQLRHNSASPTLEVSKPDTLVSRQQARLLLANVHVSTLWRWERAGHLSPVRIDQGNKRSAVFYRMSDLQRIVGGQS
jgi:hypothetical protein